LSKTFGAMLIAVVVLACIGSALEARERPALTDSEDTPAAGSIEGTVTLRMPRPRRSASRYPGGLPATHQEQEVPAVAYVVGRVSGVSAGADDMRAVMSQRDTAFVPAAVVVPVGGTVDFPNADPFFHNVLSFSEAQRFDLGRYPEGESKEVTFDQPGVVKVYCEVHEFMRGAVIVTESPFHAVVGEDGGFRIDGVPAGTYTLAVWHVDLGTVEREVTVTNGGTATVEVELGS
jgi:plastocyanin